MWCHSLTAIGVPVGVVWPFKLRKGTPLLRPRVNELLPSRRLRTIAPGVNVAGLIHALQVKEPPACQASEGEAGVVRAPWPSRRRPPSINEPSTGMPAFCETLPDPEESTAGCACSAK